MRVARILGSLLLVLVGVGLAPAPAGAAYCSKSGVHVVVDFAGQGGGVRTGCMGTTSAVTADRAFPGAGFALTYVQSQPGAVCRVSGAPSTAGCQQMPPASAYWGLFESHQGGGWTYSQRGVGGVRLNPGDSVAFVWQNGGDTDFPGAAPGPVAVTKPAPPPKPAPGTSGPTGGSTGGSGGGSTTGSASGGAASGGTGSLPAPGTPEATALAQLEQAQKRQTQQKAQLKKAQLKKAQQQKARASASASPTDDPSTSTVSAASSDEDSVTGRSVSPWIPIGIIAALIAAGTTAVLLRRRAG